MLLIFMFYICLREGMNKMKEVYTNNTALGDPSSIDKKLEQNAEKLHQLNAEMKKNQVIF